jgi:GTP-binding protein
MKFTDELVIDVSAGTGGAGCLSFRREKFVPRGGPDGGDGGDGGSIYLKATDHLNTLSIYRHRRIHRADNGASGMGRLRRGKSGEDIYLEVPVGTVVYDADTDELLGDLTSVDDVLCVAQGGFHGLGNARYKSSTNRAPRQTTQGTPGDQRHIRLELRLLADVGLLGVPNAGKSTLVQSISNARPKVAAYPFTTLDPMLGVVAVTELDSFVISDIPGLIDGAAEGVGLGLQFLKHLSRCRVLWHLVDLSSETRLTDFQVIERALADYHLDFSDKPRWLVLNKIDLLMPEDCAARRSQLLADIGWTGPVFEISGATQAGTSVLCQQVIRLLSMGSEVP